MSALFPLDIPYPPGFSYFPEFITAEEEKLLLEEISRTHLHAFIFQGFTAKRKVASFGFDYSFDKKQLVPGKSIPAGFNFLLEKVAQKLSIPANDFGELLVIEYPQDAVMNWHRDAPPFDLIAGISLLSDCVFKLRPYDKSRQGRKSILSFPVRRRSLYVMHKEVRTEWEHSVAPAKNVRYSITLRTLVK